MSLNKSVPYLASNTKKKFCVLNTFESCYFISPITIKAGDRLLMITRINNCGTTLHLFVVECTSTLLLVLHSAKPPFSSRVNSLFLIVTKDVTHFFVVVVLRMLFRIRNQSDSNNLRAELLSNKLSPEPANI